MSLFQEKDLLNGAFSFAGKASIKKYNFRLKRKTNKIKKNAFMNAYISSIQKNLEDSAQIKSDLNDKKFNIEKIEFSNLTYKKNKSPYQGDNYKYHKRNQKIFELKKIEEKSIKNISNDPHMLYTTREEKPKKLRYIYIGEN